MKLVFKLRFFITAQVSTVWHAVRKTQEEKTVISRKVDNVVCIFDVLALAHKLFLVDLKSVHIVSLVRLKMLFRRLIV